MMYESHSPGPRKPLSRGFHYKIQAFSSSLTGSAASECFAIQNLVYDAIDAIFRSPRLSLRHSCFFGISYVSVSQPEEV